MSNWLDTQTKAILQGAPPEKWAPPATGTFGLVLLEDFADRRLVARTVQWICRCELQQAEQSLARRRPTVVAMGLSVEDALIGQFELVSCDCVAIFLADEVILAHDVPYLDGLCVQVRKSSEFELVPVDIHSVPSTDEGRRFVEQFFPVAEAGTVPPEFPCRRLMMRKKARLMSYWGAKCGAAMSVTDPL